MAFTKTTSCTSLIIMLASGAMRDTLNSCDSSIDSLLIAISSAAFAWFLPDEKVVVRADKVTPA